MMIVDEHYHAILKQNPEIWDLFTQKEEYISIIRDQFDRFRYYASKNRDIFEPKVSQFLINQGLSGQYPSDAPFAVCLTHDVDYLYVSPLMKGISALNHLRNIRFSLFLHSIIDMRSKKIPLWNFYEILALEEKYGAKSSFYFMVQDLGDQDYEYNIEDCMDIIQDISDRGWEVGLHGGHAAYVNPVEIKEKKQRLEKILNRKVIGYRNHYLRFKVPETWEYLANAGFEYDSTFGYADCIGFRNGMCHPFKPYNLNTQCEIDILEIPLIIMDRSLDLYMGFDPDRAWDITIKVINTVAECHGIITLLWHNTELVKDNMMFYERILKYCAEKKAWMTSGEKILKWAQNRK